MPDLHYVPFSEFNRIRSLEIKAEERAALFADLCRVNTLYMIMKAGSGHIGSSFSSLDIVSWLYLEELQKEDLYFSSKGHDAPGFYSALIGTGRIEFEKIHELRTLGGLPGHPDVEISEVVTNTGSLGMGVSKAKGIIKAHRLQNKKANVYVMTGDGELQEGQFWESLVSAANDRLHEITVIVDHNKIQSDIWVSQVSDLGDLEKKFESFGWHVERCNGNDMTEFAKTLQSCKQVQDKPKVIIADTVKGSGVSFMQGTELKEGDRLYGYHSGAPSFEIYQKAFEELRDQINQRLKNQSQSAIEVITTEGKEKPDMSSFQNLPKVYSEVIVKEAKQNEKIVALDADLALDCGLLAFEKEFPNRFVECGIAEQDMVSQAGAMALKGLLPIVHSFACFLSARPNEQIYNNATEKTKVIYSAFLAGLIPAGPGHSHQAVRDIASLSGVPGLTMIEPCHSKELEQVLSWAVSKNQKSTYLRLVSIPCDLPFEVSEDYQLVEGQGSVIAQGEDAILFTYGPVMVSQACQVAEQLKAEEGISLCVVNLPWLNSFDTEWLSQIVAPYSFIFTLDDHYLQGGQGEKLAACFAQREECREKKVTSFGLQEIPSCGKTEEVLKEHGLDVETLKSRIKRKVGVQV